MWNISGTEMATSVSEMFLFPEGSKWNISGTDIPMSVRTPLISFQGAEYL